MNNIDTFYYPYGKAKLWTKNLVWLCASHFLLHVSLYLMIPVLVLWTVHGLGGTYADAGLSIAVFGAGALLPGMFNAWLIDRFSRKDVALFPMLLLAGSFILYPYAVDVWQVAGLRALQGVLFGLTTMATGSTLAIDVTASYRRTDANVAFARFGRIGMVVGLLAGILLYPRLEFMDAVYACTVSSIVGFLLLLPVQIPFHAPLYPSVCSLDRFLLPRTFPPGINLLVIAFVFGVLLMQISHEFFYLCLLAGVCLAPLFSHWMSERVSGHALMEMGFAALLGGLLLLAFVGGVAAYCVGGLLVGVGVALVSNRFLLKMVRLPLHCQRGTGNNTYQLLWELGVMGGFALGCIWAELHPGASLLLLCNALCVAGLVLYEVFTRSWCRRRMEERDENLRV